MQTDVSIKQIAYLSSPLLLQAYVMKCEILLKSIMRHRKAHQKNYVRIMLRLYLDDNFNTKLNRSLDNTS